MKRKKQRNLEATVIHEGETLHGRVVGMGTLDDEKVAVFRPDEEEHFPIDLVLPLKDIKFKA